MQIWPLGCCEGHYKYMYTWIFCELLISILPSRTCVKQIVMIRMDRFEFEFKDRPTIHFNKIIIFVFLLFVLLFMAL